MKKLFTLLLAVLLVLGLAGCSSKSNTATTDDTTKFVVGFDAEFPPYGYVAEDGSYDGFDLAMAKEVCDRLGWEFVAQPINWDSKDAELNSGNITCIWNGFTINGREDSYTWSDAYVDNTIVVVVPEGSTITSIADLAGKQVMVQAASSGAEALAGNEYYDQMTVVELGDYSLGFADLDQGQVDAVVIDAGVAKYQMANRTNKYTVLDEAVASEQYGVGFKLGNTEVRDAVNKVLLEMAQDGTMAKIAENYVDAGLETSALCLVK